MKRGATFATYDSYEQFMRVLARRNPRTPSDRLEFVARSWARQGADGRIELWADPKHKHVNPVLYQRDQAEACWRAIVAPLLLVLAEESELTKRMAGELGEERLRGAVRESDDADHSRRRAHDPSRAPRRDRRAAGQDFTCQSQYENKLLANSLNRSDPRPLAPALQFQLAGVAQVALEQCLQRVARSRCPR